MVYNIFIREKKDGTFRVILNLKEMNKLIQKKKFKMETLQSAISLMTKNCFFSSIDLKDAYFSVNIRRKDRKYFRFRFDGNLYEFSCLPQGYTESPRIFTKLLKPALGQLRSQGHNLVAYIDDTLLQGDSKEECQNNVKSTGKILDKLGYTIHPKKSVFEPSQKIQFLGFILDSTQMNVSITEEKKISVTAKIRSLLKSKTVTIRQFSEVLGCLTALNPGVWIGHMFCKRLEIEKIFWLRLSGFNYDRKRTLCPIIKKRSYLVD